MSLINKPEHQARKRFGQNFLHDRAVIERLVAFVAAKEGDALIEIGPGLGALTKPLLADVVQMTAIELDRDLIAGLAALSGLTVIHQDALKVNLQELAQQFTQPLRLVGNLPYNISTPLIFHFLQYQAYLKDMHFMLQKEVVERMAACAGDDAYGRLSVMVQYHCQVEPLLLIYPDSFKPAPKVDSQFVRLVPHAVAPVVVEHPQHFAHIVQAAFGQRRKTLRNSLKHCLDAELIKQADIDPMARAETIDLAGFARLANQYTAICCVS